jgi:hypothetical protein
MCIVGGLAAGFFAMCALVFICLVAIAAVGEAASSDFESVSQEQNAMEFSQRAESSQPLARGR